MTNAIQTDALTKRFGRQAAVDALTLAVPAGATFALLGPNGAGKSTTLKLLLNLLSPTRGTAQVLGCDSRKLGPRERAQIGFVAEGQDLPDTMTVRRFIDYCRPFYPTWDRELEAVLLRTFALPLEKKLKHLSRGMRMKAAMLSALAFRPRLLLLDEPFSGLDPVARDDFIHGLIEVSLLGDWTVLLSSHDIEEVERLADHVAIMDQGRLRLTETLDSLQARFRKVEITLAAPTDAVAAADAGRRAAPGAPGSTWLEWAQSGTLLRFIESAYTTGESERAYAALLPPGAKIDASPLPLREIYLVLSRMRKAVA